jgi:acyl-homoserine-lactone acylase
MVMDRRFKFGAAAALMALVAGSTAQAKTAYQATITRTTYGVPHIQARDFAGLGYGAGYTAAEDSACVIAEQRIAVRGERSRYFGAETPGLVGFGPMPNLQSDIYYRMIADPKAIHAAFAKTSAENRAAVAGFAAGYNRFIKNDAARLPESCRGAAWVQPMSVDDVLLIANSFAQLLQSSLARPMATTALPVAGVPAKTADLDMPSAEEEIGQDIGMGSNGWAFGGDVTADGRGMVVGNPHFPWNGPNRFRQMHLTIPGKVDVMGAGMVASPLIVLGFNHDVAWTHTVSTALHASLFRLDLDPADPTAYFVDGKREKMTRETVTIAVKDGPAVTHDVWSTRYGHVVSFPQAGFEWDASHAYAVRDANAANLRYGDTWIAMSKAKSVGEIRSAIGSTLGLAFINTIAADRSGNALYADVSAIPDVSAEKLARCGVGDNEKYARTLRLVVLDGSKSACNWDIDPAAIQAGLASDRDAPTLVTRDYVQNSNDSYWLSNATTPLPQAGPLHGDYGAEPSFRTQSGVIEIGRLRDAGNGKIAREPLRTAVLANKSLTSERMLDAVLKLCPSRPDVAKACAALAGWNRRADLDSTGAILFFDFSGRAANIPGVWSVPFDPKDPIQTPRGLVTEGAPGAALLDALAASVAELDKQHIPLDAALGDIQRAPRGAERIPVHGGPQSAGILNIMISTPENGQLLPMHGSSYIQIVGFDDNGPVADAVLSYSQSTDPASPHFADQTRAFSAKQWNRLPFTAAEIAKAKEGESVEISE